MKKNKVFALVFIWTFFPFILWRQEKEQISGLRIKRKVDFKTLNFIYIKSPKTLQQNLL